MRRTTLAAALAVGTRENVTVNSAPRPLAPLELALDKYSAVPENVLFALVRVYPLDPQPPLMSVALTPLHSFCRLHPQDARFSVRVLKALLKAHPHWIQTTDHAGRLPLHLACRSNAPSEFVQELVSVYAKAASVADKSGMLPLHCLCTPVLVPEAVFKPNEKKEFSSFCWGDEIDGDSLPQPSAKISTVQVLLRAFPEALYAQDGQGRLPIHCACARGNEQEEVIREMLRVDPSIAAFRCGGGGGGGGGGGCHRQQLPLFIACCVIHSTRVVDHLLRAFPQAAGIPDAMGCLPLCHVSRNWQRKRRLLVDAYPGALFHKCPTCRKAPLDNDHSSDHKKILCSKQQLSIHGRDGGYFLHMVCRNRRLSPSVLRLIVSTFPPAISTANALGQLPLHVALANEPGSLSALHCLVELFPLALHLADAHGQLPLHVALANETGVSITDIQHLVKTNSQALFIKDASGRLPLHVALANTGRVSSDILHYLVETNPQALSVTDASGRLPLHTALANEYGRNAGVVNYLVETNPQALDARDASGCLPLHTALANKAIVLDSVVEYLVKANPEALCAKNAAGCLPLHVAASNVFKRLLLEDVALIQLLVESHGAALYTPTNDGSLPFMLACQNPKASMEVLYHLLRHYPAALAATEP